MQFVSQQVMLEQAPIAAAAAAAIVWVKIYLALYCDVKFLTFQNWRCDFISMSLAVRLEMEVPSNFGYTISAKSPWNTIQ